VNSDIQASEINKNLYKASIHMIEASKFMANVDKNIAIQIMAMADKMLSIINPIEETKVSKEKIDSILDEIFNTKE
jgi:hypothetical protein